MASLNHYYHLRHIKYSLIWQAFTIIFLVGMNGIWSWCLGIGWRENLLKTPTVVKKQKENIEFPVEFPSNLSKLQYA